MVNDVETIPNLAPWSFTKLRAFEQCPRAGRARYVTKDMPWVDTVAKDKGREYHEAFERYINDNVPLPDSMADCAEFVPMRSTGDTYSFEAEVELGITEEGEPCAFHDPFVWFRCKLDLLDISLNGTGHPDLAFIIDWKTGKKWEDPDELHLHAMTAKAHYPEVRHWRGMYVWLRDHKVGTMHTLQPAKTLTRLRERIRKIEADFGDIARKNVLCPWCDLNRCEHWTGTKKK